MDTTAAADDEVRPDAPDMAAATKAHLSEAAATAAPAEAEEADSDDQPPLSRKERKALDKEIPWREIAKDTAERFQLYVEATWKEVNSFHK